ncbi:MAG: YbaB/EbfC family nucleoid-associated protein [Dethiobacteria bacterium]|jgi:DNA-binding YbaB/EbfC family protein
MGKMNKMIKQMQQAQNQILKLQKEVEARTVEATSGGGVVRAVVSGGKNLLELHLDPELLQEDDIEMVQDLIISAVNEALRQADEMVASEMQKLTGGLGLPKGIF